VIPLNFIKGAGPGPRAACDRPFELAERDFQVRTGRYDYGALDDILNSRMFPGQS
jgi:hypothetical protein